MSYILIEPIYSKSGTALCTTTPTTKYRKDVGMDRRQRRGVPKDKESNTTNNRNKTFQEKPNNANCVLRKP